MQLGRICSQVVASRQCAAAERPALVCRSASSDAYGSQPSTSSSGSTDYYSNGAQPSRQPRTPNGYPSMQQPRSSSGRPQGYPSSRSSRLPYNQRPGGRGAQGGGSMDGDDPFAAFRSYQQAAALQAAGVGNAALEAGLRPDQGWLPPAPQKLRPLQHRGWQAQPGYTFQSLHEEILRRCEMRQPGIGPLFMLIKLADTRDDARMVLDAIAAVRTALARKGNLAPLQPQLCALIPKMCCTCDAPDVLAEALQRSNELGLELSHNRVHEVLRDWGAALELYKLEQVVGSMESGGLPPNTKTAYILVRAAINAGRLDKAGAYARQMRAQGVRLHHSTMRLLETGQRAAQGAAVGARADTAGGLFYGGGAAGEEEGLGEGGAEGGRA